MCLISYFFAPLDMKFPIKIFGKNSVDLTHCLPQFQLFLQAANTSVKYCRFCVFLAVIQINFAGHQYQFDFSHNYRLALERLNDSRFLKIQLAVLIRHTFLSTDHDIICFYFSSPRFSAFLYEWTGTLILFNTMSSLSLGPSERT